MKVTSDGMERTVGAEMHPTIEASYGLMEVTSYMRDSEENCSPIVSGSERLSTPSPTPL